MFTTQSVTMLINGDENEQFAELLTNMNRRIIDSIKLNKNEVFVFSTIDSAVRHNEAKNFDISRLLDVGVVSHIPAWSLHVQPIITSTLQTTIDEEITKHNKRIVCFVDSVRPEKLPDLIELVKLYGKRVKWVISIA